MRTIPLPLETPRLLLRDFSTHDTSVIQSISENPGFHFVLLDGNDHNTGDKFIARCIREVGDLEPASGLRRHYRLAITIKDSQELIGYVGLFNVDFNRADGELGFFIAPKSQSIGYASEAAQGLITAAWDTLKLESIYATVRDDNAVSQSILRRLGMTPESTINNQYTDDVTTRMLMRVRTPRLP